jgi:hypothetical protein
MYFDHTQRVRDLFEQFRDAACAFISRSREVQQEPGAWFKEKWAEWQTTIQEWRERQRHWKDSRRRNGVVNVSSKEPSYFSFTFEDWALLCIRYEIHLLIHAYGRDVDGFLQPFLPQDQLSATYHTYFSKDLEVHAYGFKEFDELAEIIKDTVSIEGKHGHLTPRLGIDADVGHFIELVEAHRNERRRRIDAGDSSAVLNFQLRLMQPVRRGLGSLRTELRVAARPNES